MRIGILIKDFEALRNWELRVINEIRNNPTLELCLLIKDGRTRPKGSKGQLLNLIKSKSIIGKVLFKIQTIIESKLFPPPVTEDKQETIAYLQTVPSVSLTPTRKGFLDVFGKKEAERVKEHKLDIILRHEFNIIRGDILTASTYGIWSFHHGDNAINRGGPAGFWEVVLKQPVTGVTLQQLTPELDGGLIIDKGFFNTDWSFFRNNNTILEESVDILFKNIRQLQQDRLSLKKSPLYYNPLYRSPKLPFVVKYIWGFYANFWSRISKKVFHKLFGFRYDCWTLFFGKGNFIESTLFRLKPIRLPKNEFWADPFLFQHENEMYVFFESYSYKTGKGKIVCGKIAGKEIQEVKDVLDLDHHLSYPFIFSDGGEIYMIPESAEARRVEVFKCVQFPDKWEKHATAFEGEEIVDTSFYKDPSGQRWLFLNKGFGNIDSGLYIYKIDSPKLTQIESHAQNPVIIDSRVARNAGPIYKHGDMLIRPSQNNSGGIYGYGLNLNEIKTLTLDEYEEEKIISVEPNFIKGLTAMHHLHQVDGRFIIDGAFRRK